MPEDVLKVHEQRVIRFNDEAESLLGLVTEGEEVPYMAAEVEHSKGVKCGMESHEGCIHSKFDSEGNVVARYVMCNGKPLGLDEGPYSQFREFTGKLLKEEGIRRYVSLVALENTLFDWFAQRISERSQDGMWEFFEAQLRPRIVEQTVDIPITHLWVEKSFRVGKVELAPITPEKMAEWYPMPEDTNDRFERDYCAAMRQRQWHSYKGLAFSTVKVIAEPYRAKEIAYSFTEDALSFLSMYSPAAFLPNAVFVAAPFGSENVRTEDCYVWDGFGNHRRFDEPTELRESRVPFDALKIDDALRSGLNLITELYCKPKHSAFERDVLQSLLLFLRHTRARTLSEKVIFIFVALDSFLLTDSKESIQANIGRRIAYTIGRTPAERKQIDKTIKSAYNIRSAYIHHAKTEAEEQVVRELLLIGFSYYLLLVENAGRYRERQDYTKEIDDKVWG